jgi:hypothetical protein
MMKYACLLLMLLSVLVFAGCSRTKYMNVAPLSRRPTHPASEVAKPAPNSWQHFWVYGLAPSEKAIDAAAECGGVEHVRQIETRQTFVQGLIAAFAGYYINIYSPYTGAVICDHTRQP